METHSTLFFSDGKKTIDFVLVYKSTQLNEPKMAVMEFFLDNLKKTGLSLEVDQFSVDPATYFVKIHIPKEICLQYADIFGIDLAFRTERKMSPSIPFKFMSTSLTRPDPDDPIYSRAPDTVSGNLPSDITSSERIMIVNVILNRMKFSNDRGAYGIQNLISGKIFTDAFPVHEGPHEWPESGPLTDRQLLSRFWGSPKCWYKEQPLNLIEKYYGTEMAFYFAWLGLYIKSLLVAAALSILCLIYGLITFNTVENMRSEEICDSHIVMCPKCHYAHCKTGKLANSCLTSYVTYLFDNPATIAYAILISFWSTIFMEMWGRNQATLQLQWNVKDLEHDLSMRPEYVEAAVSVRISAITGLSEPYIPKKIRIARYAVTTASVALMLIIMVLATFGVIVYRLAVSLIIYRTSGEKMAKYSQVIASTTGSFISVVFILIFKMIYAEVALWLTDLENHRTQYQYDHSYIYKSYALAFTNHYSAVFYIAFFKGRFYTHPGDMSLWSNLGGLASDICDPTGCILDLSVQLVFIMIIKIFVNNFMQVLLPVMLGFKYRRKHKIDYRSDLLCFEKDYLKASLDRYYLMEEYMDLVIQYGFVVFFVAGFPLAPVFALINNFIELRVDAYKLTHHYRRPVPNKVADIGAWMSILQALTYLGVVTNAIVIAFTSEFVPKEIYKHQVDYNLKGFVNTTISAYDLSETDPTVEPGTICYYPGNRYPPDHPQKYKLSTDYWFMLAMRFLVVVIFEHVVMMAKGAIAYAIPDVPAHVTERLIMEERKNKDLRMKALAKKDTDADRKKKRRASVLDSMK